VDARHKAGHDGEMIFAAKSAGNAGRYSGQTLTRYLITISPVMPSSRHLDRRLLRQITRRQRRSRSCSLHNGRTQCEAAMSVSF
jgi:hypothetical protein